MRSSSSSSQSAHESFTLSFGGCSAGDGCSTTGGAFFASSAARASRSAFLAAFFAAFRSAFSASSIASNPAANWFFIVIGLDGLPMR